VAREVLCLSKFRIVPVRVSNCFDSILFEHVFSYFILFDLILNYSIRIYLVIHIFHWASLLTPYIETMEHSKNYLRPPPDMIKGKEQYKVEAI
jgi:hypothetical protein